MHEPISSQHLLHFSSFKCLRLSSQSNVTLTYPWMTRVFTYGRGIGSRRPQSEYVEPLKSSLNSWEKTSPWMSTSWGGEREPRPLSVQFSPLNLCKGNTTIRAPLNGRPHRITRFIVKVLFRRSRNVSFRYNQRDCMQVLCKATNWPYPDSNTGAHAEHAGMLTATPPGQVCKDLHVRAHLIWTCAACKMQQLKAELG